MGNELFLDIRRTGTIKISLENKIWYANDYILELLGYDLTEFITNRPKIVCDKDMPDIIHDEIGKAIMNFGEGVAVLKHKTKYGDYFWAFTHYKPVYKPDGSFEAFLTRRKPIPAKKVHGSAGLVKEKVERLYKVLKEIEQYVSYKAAQKYLEGYLEDKGYASLADFYMGLFDMKPAEIEQYFSIDEKTPQKVVKKFGGNYLR